MTVKIDQDKCIGCGACTFLAPKIFRVDTAKGKAKVIAQPGKETEELKSAVSSCPTQAIIVD